MRYFKLIFFKERDEEDDEGNKEGRHEWRQCDVAGMRPVAAVTGRGCSADVLLPLIYLRFL